MTTQHSIGSIARLYLDLIASGTGATGQSPTIAIKRIKDGKWFQASDDTWQVNLVANPATELDSVNMPGRYYVDFDQTKDLESASRLYTAKKMNSGSPVFTGYEDLSFGPLAATVSPLLCSVQGTVLDPTGDPLSGEIVIAALQPTLTDGAGRAFSASIVSKTYTNSQGDFDLGLVRGGIYRLQIGGVGYDRKVTIPQQSSVLFTDL